MGGDKPLPYKNCRGGVHPRPRVNEFYKNPQPKNGGADAPPFFLSYDFGNLAGGAG